MATPIIKFGFRKSIIFSLGGSAIGIGLLFIAVLIKEISWLCAITGGIVIGITSSVWWTIQGVYFEFISLRIDKHLYASSLDNIADAQKVRIDLSAVWTIVYLLVDLFIFSFIALLLYTGVNIKIVFGILTLLSIITTFLGFTFESIENSENSSILTQDEWMEEIIRVPKQFKNDVRISLFIPYIFAFGATTAMFSYYINLHIISDSSNLGVDSLGALSAFSDLVAILTAYPNSYISNNYKNGQNCIIQLSACCFLLCGLTILLGNMQNLANWPAMLFVKSLHGFGRGVFEGFCRAVYAQMFTGKELVAAFSVHTLSTGLSSGICFFLFNALNSKTSIAAIVSITSFLAIISYQVLITVDSAKKSISWNEFLNLFIYCCNNYYYYENNNNNNNNNQQRNLKNVKKLQKGEDESIVNNILSDGLLL
jgi:hypothetical protein